jgi:hypothetical protein
MTPPINSETLDAETLERRLHLWFFRDLTGEQRLGLFKLCGYPVDELPTHAVQEVSLRHLVGQLAARRAANTPAGDGWVMVDPSTILAARDALLADNLNEAWHQLYTMADPTFTEMEPWRNLEHKAALSASPALPSQVVGVSREAFIAEMSIELQKHPSFDDNTVGSLVWAGRLYDAAAKSCITSPAAEAVGEAGSMPGTEGFTMAAFKASEVPIGTKLYTHPALSASREVTEADIERAAKAIAESAGDVAWEKIEPLYQEGYRDEARAALTAALILPERGM